MALSESEEEAESPVESHVSADRISPVMQLETRRSEGRTGEGAAAAMVEMVSSAEMEIVPEDASAAGILHADEVAGIVPFDEEAGSRTLAQDSWLWAEARSLAGSWQ
jgi:hypothetical protein